MDFETERNKFRQEKQALLGTKAKKEERGLLGVAAVNENDWLPEEAIQLVEKNVEREAWGRGSWRDNFPRQDHEHTKAKNGQG